MLGGTTNSDSGVTAFENFLPTFAEMEKHDLVLNLHGEVVSSLSKDGLSLEEAFLPTLKSIYELFPRLRIVLEHCSTAAAIDAVRACGPTVAGSLFYYYSYLSLYSLLSSLFKKFYFLIYMGDQQQSQHTISI